MEKKGGHAREESVEESIKELQEEQLKVWRYNEAEYLVSDRDYYAILCFEGIVSKNAVVSRLAKLFRSLRVAEYLVFRWVEVGLLKEVVIYSYPTTICKGKGKKRKCEEVNKDVFGLQQGEELRAVCESKKRPY